MKKYLVIAAAAVAALSACTKTTVDSTPDVAISFQVANYQASTKADNYDTNYKAVPFGTYAWFYETGKSYKANPTEGQAFMDNETISHHATEERWEPSITYYWPKTGTVDFISYSPKTASDNITVVANKITVADYTVADKTDVDLMYADKAVGCSANATTYNHTGVPTLFRHALAKVNVSILQSALTDGKTPATTWKVTVKKVTFSNILNKGGVELNLNTTDYQTWDLPKVGTEEYHTFTTSGDKIASTDLYADATGTVLTTTAQSFATDYIVMPQVLAAAGQQMTVTYDIVTTLANGKTITETNATATIDLVSGSLKAWEMNKNITYAITITPSEEKPIYFDPAVVAWDDTPATAGVQL